MHLTLGVEVEPPLELHGTLQLLLLPRLLRGASASLELGLRTPLLQPAAQATSSCRKRQRADRYDAKRDERGRESEVDCIATWRDLARCALLVGRDDMPEMRALATFAEPPGAGAPGSGCLLKRARALLQQVASTASAAQAHSRLVSGGREELQWLSLASDFAWSNEDPQPPGCTTQSESCLG